MDRTVEIKNLELRISEVEDEVRELKNELSDKEITLSELKEELRYQLIKEKTNNVTIGDSLFFIDENDLEVEMMLISDSKGHLDLVFLTDCSHIADSMGRGMKMNKRYLCLDSLIKDIEDNDELRFMGYDE